eukprot:227547-Chlamydomonas_euryale.AAC.1
MLQWRRRTGAPRCRHVQWQPGGLCRDADAAGRLGDRAERRRGGAAAEIGTPAKAADPAAPAGAAAAQAVLAAQLCAQPLRQRVCLGRERARELGDAVARASPAAARVGASSGRQPARHAAAAVHASEAALQPLLLLVQACGAQRGRTGGKQV